MKRFCAVFLALISPALAQQPGYAERPEVRAFIRELVERHGFIERELLAMFARVQRTEPVLQAVQAPAERRPWEEYRANFLSEPLFAELPCVLETGKDGGAPAAEDVSKAKRLYARGRSTRSRRARAGRKR